MSSIVNRNKFEGGSTPVSMRVSERTMQQVAQIQSAFREKYPQGLFPNLSHLLTLAIEHYIQEVGNDEAKLQVEVDDFQKRYAGLRRGKKS